MGSRFAEALNRSAESIVRPPPLPVGSYLCRVTKLPDPPESMDTKVGELEKLTVNVAVIEALEDVDPDMLAEFGIVKGVPLRRDFLFAVDDDNKFEQSMFRLRSFCEHCGLDIEGKSIGDLLNELPNTQFVAAVGHRADRDDPMVSYAEIKYTAPVS
jgi:hypothetical protein